MKIKILFEKEKIHDQLESGWGLAYLVGEEVLFDTGEKFEYLEHNARCMGVDLARVKKIVISHTHWDHTSGLWELLARYQGITVYGAPLFNQEFQDKVAASGAQYEIIKDVTEIAPDIFISGVFVSRYQDSSVIEHALVVRSGKGFSIITGCAHIGALNVLQRVAGHFGGKAYALLGGLHLMDKEKRFTEFVVSELPVLVSKVYAGHCTGHDGMCALEQSFKDNSVELKVGMEIEV